MSPPEVCYRAAEYEWLDAFEANARFQRMPNAHLHPDELPLTTPQGHVSEVITRRFAALSSHSAIPAIRTAPVRA
jgi:hypothetical protein